MPVKVEFEKLEDAPEGLRAALVETDGKYVFEGESVNEIKGLRTALKAEREAKSKYEKDLGRFKDLDPERYQQLLADAEQAEADKLRKQGKADELHQRELQKIKDAYAIATAEKDKDIAARDAILDRLTIDAAVSQATAAAGVRAGALDIVLQMARDVFRREGDQVTVKDPAMINPKTGKEISIEDWLGDQAASRPFLFGETKGSGAGTTTTGGTPGQKKLADMEPADKVAFIAKHGAAAFQQKIERERMGAAAAER